MILKWIEYNELLATNHPDLRHQDLGRNSFIGHAYEEEGETAMQNDLADSFVMMGSVAGEPSGDQDNRIIVSRAVVYFLSTAGEEFTTITKERQLTFDIMIDFLSRYESDAILLGACGPFRKFDINKASWQQVGPMFNNSFGWKLTVLFSSDGSALSYNSKNWRT